MIVASFWGYLNLFFSICFLVWYGIFIVLVAIEDRKQVKQKPKLYDEMNDEMKENLVN